MALSNAELAQMQADAETFLPGTCVIMRPTAGTSDGMGGMIGGTVSAAGTAACRIRPMGRPGSGNLSEHEASGRLFSLELWTITLPNGTDVRTTDRITSDNVTYEVVGTPTGGSWEITRAVYAKVVS